MRWRLSEENDGQGALFEDDPERHIGTGEFRGMEFLHVNARTIINEVPRASQLPFRWTINAYRGCSHRCAYCLEGSTPVLLSSGRARPIGELRVGDEVIGTQRVGSYRRFVRTPVLDCWSTVKRAYGVRLDDGSRLIASGDHRFLSDRGWKFVVGDEQGRERRAHLTQNNSLLGLGPFPRGPVGGPQYQRGYLCGMVRGDAYLARFTPKGRPNTTCHRFRLALVDMGALGRSRRCLREIDVETREFLFAKAVGDHKAMWAISTSRRDTIAAIEHAISWPTESSDEWARGYLAGVFDAEGSYSDGILRISNTDSQIISYLTDCLDKFDFSYTVENPRPGMQVVRIVGGQQEHLRFFLTVDPAITRKRSIEGRALKNSPQRRVVSIEDLGIELPMYDITTGTGDFIANGVVSHNCFARPTHEYLGMNAGEDFERKIVVKVNAVDRLKAELNPARWAGEHIAMGTNTDPYQRCEGKYRLTRGIVEVLAEHANPFSILTKSTLILRDLDVLTEAARRADVRANLSIGTLDDEVWKTSEPGTPHPRKRVEAVAKLNEAGIPTGVLVAPVLPGLSDRPDQLRDVVKACADAGAVTISPILLHLRPGVREQYMPWLEKARPDVLPLYDELYQRSYAPKAVQQRVTKLVYGYVRQFGSLAVQPGNTRDTGHEKARAATTPRRRAAPPAQLDLDLGDRP